MKRLILLQFLFFAITSTVIAKEKKEKDKEAIKNICGCFEVSFNFAETFEYSKDTAYKPSKVKLDRGLEWVELVEDSDNKIVMQHLLIVGSPENQYVIKHWRQDWLYENRDLYMYDANNLWKYNKFRKKNVKGQWTQKVFQVDDSPRYEGSASWVHVDGESFWENTTDAPLPRREYTKRNDYNVLVRTNKHAITKSGWIHDQDNNKIIREMDKRDVLLAQEKGFNNYIRVDNKRCIAAQDYWLKNKANWKIVRSQWDDIFAGNKDLKLKTAVNNKSLYMYLFSDEFKFSNESVSSLISQYIVD
jgi:hypothetical protein